MLVESSEVTKKESSIELLMFASTYKGLRIESLIILLIFELTRSYTAYVNKC